MDKICLFYKGWVVPLILGFMHVTVTSHSRLCQISKIWGVTFGEWWAFQAFPKLIGKDTQKSLLHDGSWPKARQWKPQNYPDLPVPQIIPPVASNYIISTNWTLSSKYRELEDQGYLNHKYGPAELHLVNSSGPEWKKTEHFRSVTSNFQRASRL